MNQWDKLFQEKIKEVLHSQHRDYEYASLSPTASGNVARALIAEEYYAQADRIAELDKIVKNTIGQAFYEDDFHKAEATIARQLETVDKFAEENARLSNRIAELEKQVAQQQDFIANWEKQSEPVAWKSTLQKNWFLPNEDMETGKYDKQFWIPLYTTPQTNPLSDEEITAIWQTDECYQNAQAFARAIEAKARSQ